MMTCLFVRGVWRVACWCCAVGRSACLEINGAVGPLHEPSTRGARGFISQVSLATAGWL